MELSKKQRDAIQSCEQRPHNLPLVEASNAQEKKVLGRSWPLACNKQFTYLLKITY